MADQTIPQEAENEKNQKKEEVYFNAFNINNTLVDFQLELKLNGNTIETYNMAPITAKNLGLQLLSMTGKYEHLTGTKIEDFNDLKKRTQEKMKEDEELKKEQEKKEKHDKQENQQNQDNGQIPN